MSADGAITACRPTPPYARSPDRLYYGWNTMTRSTRLLRPRLAADGCRRSLVVDVRRCCYTRRHSASCPRSGGLCTSTYRSVSALALTADSIYQAYLLLTLTQRPPLLRDQLTPLAERDVSEIPACISVDNKLLVCAGWRFGCTLVVDRRPVEMLAFLFRGYSSQGDTCFVCQLDYFRSVRLDPALVLGLSGF